jgi:hypothetical protein
MKNKEIDILKDYITLSVAIIQFAGLFVSNYPASAFVIFTLGVLPIFGSIFFIARRKNKDP